MPHSDAATDPLRRKWAATAQRHLTPVLEAASRLRVAFDAGTDSSEAEVTDPGSDLIAACAGLVEWLHGSPAPKGCGKAGAELGAAAWVFRNAAFAFRSLDEAGPEQHVARAEACQSMLDQGEHHADSFLARSGSDLPK